MAASQLISISTSGSPSAPTSGEKSFLGGFPRYALEALGMVAIALLGGLLVFQRGSGVAVIPLLGSLALGAQRLIPALQQIYSGWASLKGNNPSIHAVLAMLNQPLPPYVMATEPLPLQDCIRLAKCIFAMGREGQVLQGMELVIRRGERIGLIGSTGSGKSTTVDLLMGLLLPTAGRVLVDDADLHDSAHPEDWPLGGRLLHMCHKHLLSR